ncbi:hypothetical protein [Phaeobacter phage MD18]|nr:hypothetical protein [Phaeobacter phage MD18]
MNPLIMSGTAPLSWRLGVTGRKPGKRVNAFGPIRLSYHNLAGK